MTQIEETFELLPVEQILPNPEQPRAYFDPEELRGLSESIVKHSLLQPIRVEGPYTNIEGHKGPVYFLVDGERRLRATKLAQILTIKAVVDSPHTKDGKHLVNAIIANLQRSDLNAVEEARAFGKLRANRWLIRDIARMVGRSIGHVDLRLKLLEFEQEIQELLAAGKLPIDPNVIYGLFKLPDAIRVKMAMRYAQKEMTVFGIRHSLSRILNHYGESTDRDLTQTKTSPALEMAGKPENASRIFINLSKEGIAPAWSLIEEAAKATCNSCELSDMASVKMCQDCPAVELVKRITKLASE